MSTNRDVERVRREVMLEASGQGFSEHAEDLAHDVVVKLLEGKGEKQRIGQATIDAVRHHFGDNRRKSKRGGLGRTIYIEDEPLPAAIAVTNPNSRDIDLSIQAAIDRLEERDRVLLRLFYKWGFTCHELGKLYNLTPAAIMARVHRIKKSMGYTLKRTSTSDLTPKL